MDELKKTRAQQGKGVLAVKQRGASAASLHLSSTSTAPPIDPDPESTSPSRAFVVKACGGGFPHTCDMNADVFGALPQEFRLYSQFSV